MVIRKSPTKEKRKFFCFQFCSTPNPYSQDVGFGCSKFLCLFLVESWCVTVVGEVLQWLSVYAAVIDVVFGVLTVGWLGWYPPGCCGKVWISSENLSGEFLKTM
jgi:hypothetical protein